MNEADILELLKTRLSLNVQTSYNYNGGMNGQSLYEDRHTIQLLLDNEVISEVSL